MSFSAKIIIVNTIIIFIAVIASALTCNLTIDDSDNDPEKIAGYRVYATDVSGDYQNKKPLLINGSDVIPAGTENIVIDIPDSGINYLTVRVVGKNGRESVASRELDGSQPRPIKELNGLWID